MIHNLEARLQRYWSSAVFLAPFVLCISVVLFFLSRRSLPWWADAGIWLKHAYGILGVVEPLWGVPPTTYPPLFSSFLALILLLTSDAVFSVKTLAVIVFSIRAIAASYASLIIFRSKTASLIASLAFTFLPLHVEILGWGGYPNLLAISFLTLSVSLLILWLRNEAKKHHVTLLFLFSVSVALTHNLASLVYLTFLLVLIISAVALRMKETAFKTTAVLIATMATVGGYVLASNSDKYYVLHNEAAYHGLALNLQSGVLTWMFKSPLILLALYFFMSAAIFQSVRVRKYRLEIGVLAAWLVSPLLLVNLHSLGLTLDYYRIFYFITEPLIFLAIGSLNFSMSTLNVNSTCFASFKTIINPKNLRNIPHSLEKTFSFLLVLGLLVTTFGLLFTGLATFQSVENWYNYKDKYGDKEKLEAVMWIKANTPSNSVVVAEEPMARWVEGIAHRKTMMYAPPMFLFIKGEQERSLMARHVLLSELAVGNGGCLLYIPSDPRGEMSTRISLFLKGAYTEVMFVNASNTYVNFFLHNHQYTNRLSDAEEYSITVSNDKVTISYRFSNMLFEQQISTDSQQKTCDIYFRVIPSYHNVSVGRFLVDFKIWNGVELWTSVVKSQGVLALNTNVGEIEISSDALSAFPFLFKGLHGFISIKISGEQRMEPVQYLVGVGNILQQMDPVYVVLPRYQQNGKENIPLTAATEDEYMHLLASPSFELVFQNSRVLILRYKSD